MTAEPDTGPFADGNSVQVILDPRRSRHGHLGKSGFYVLIYGSFLPTAPNYQCALILIFSNRPLKFTYFMDLWLFRVTRAVRSVSSL